MEKLEQAHNISIRWRSFELRPAGTVITEEYRQRILSYRPQFEKTAQEQYGISINVGPFGIDSRPSLVGAKYAEAQGKGEAYHDGIMDAYWQQALDISDETVLANIAESAGLDRANFLAALQTGSWRNEVTADISQAHQYGIGSVPSLVFDNKYLVQGAQPYPVLDNVVQQVLAKRAEE